MQKISLVARSLDAAATGCPALPSEIALVYGLHTSSVGQRTDIVNG